MGWLLSTNNASRKPGPPGAGPPPQHVGPAGIEPTTYAV